MVFELRGKVLIAVILAASGLDFLLVGCAVDIYDQGLFGGILGGSRFKTMLGEPGPTMADFITGIYDIGCAIGAVAVFVWCEGLGRKKSIVLANVAVIVGATAQATCYSHAQMAVARVIAQVGIGLSTVAVPILQTETLPSHNRGAFLGVQSALIIIDAAVAS